MKPLTYSFFFLLSVQFLSGQSKIMAKVYSMEHKSKISIGQVHIEGTSILQKLDEGTFKITTNLNGDYILQVSALDYRTIRIPITLDNTDIDLGTIYLEKDITLEQTDNLIALTENELYDDENITITAGLLQATKDVFLTKAAFDFGQAFFKVRGYDSRHGQVLFNGIPMNQLYDGRPQWNHWGGLNDVTRNQDFTHGLQPSDYSFGGILGTTNIDTRPSLMRLGTRISSSASNRTYAGRLMATHTTSANKKELSYSISASRRWAKQGYINGTLYDAFSVFGAVDYQLNKQNNIAFTTMLAYNRRGRSAAITNEVFELMGRKYNPYWGKQDGKIRNSRERKIEQPIILFNHRFTSNKIHLNTGIAYQFGPHTKSRLGYYNAPNPDPTYYRYLPSYYINSPIGANFESAKTARLAFIAKPQMNWQNVYVANQNSKDSKAVYVLYNDVSNDKILTLNSTVNIALNNEFSIDLGLTFKSLNSKNYAKIDDLLGAEFHADIDPFSDTLNDSSGNTTKYENDIFNYNYNLKGFNSKGFGQLKVQFSKWDASVSAEIESIAYQRTGIFKNDRFPDSSEGKSKKLNFSNISLKSAFTYKVTGRHWVTAQGAFLNKAPMLQNVFINPRENNGIVPNISSEKIATADLNYYLRMPKLTGRASFFYTRFSNTTDINFFFVESGVGSDFVQEVVTNMDKLHTGFELGMEYQLSSNVKAVGVLALGNYRYSNNPLVTINFDTAGAKENILNPEGNIILGKSKIDGYKLSQGPQKAIALGLEYRNPNYWWISGTANFLGNNYTTISTITRTQSFFLDPETGKPFPNATQENVNRLLAQQKMGDFYLLNLVGGKSWLIGSNYISFFASINNVFDTVYKTGGYEQSRNGNYGQLRQDNLSGIPSFGTKYWYGYGRTYFINIAISF